MSKPKMIEKVKNLSLVVLFLSTVLLLYFFWGNISFDGLKPSSKETIGKVPEIVSVLKPEEIIVNFGLDNYTVVRADDVWYGGDTGERGFVDALGKFGPAESILVKEITYAQYQQAMALKSIRAEFSYAIPMGDFCSNFKMKKAQSYDAIEAVTAIGYSVIDGGKSLFICDGKNQKYYWLDGADNKGDGSSPGTGFSALIDSIEARGYSIYYPISSYLSALGVKNDSLVPLAIEANLKNLPFRQDLYSYQTEKISALAERFFGRNFDFVRRIAEESGTVIYMYGYGQNVLTVNTDGSIEYKEEQSGGRTEQSFTEALKTAMGFVASHGSWGPLEENGKSLYLKAAVPYPNKDKGYRFVFGMEVNGSPLYYEEGDPIVVEVTYGQVTYYKRHVINFDPEDIKAVEAGAGDKETLSAVNVIAQNYQYIYDTLLLTGEINAAVNQSVTFEDVASLVNSMQIGYLKQADREITEIRPVWVVRMNDTEIYFDLYTAEPVGYSAG